MSRFDDEFAAGGMVDLFHEFGQSATYEPPDGPDVSLTMIVIHEERPVSDDEQGRTVKRRAMGTITDNPDDATYGGVTEPTEAATAKFDGERWAIEHVERTSGAWKLSLVRPELTDSSHSGFRRRV